MATYKTPGVYVEEISKLPPSVAEVETAIPAFIGYTEKDTYNGISLLKKPKRIKSLTEYVEIFGKANPVELYTGTYNNKKCIRINKTDQGFELDGFLNNPFDSLVYRMYYSLQLYFGNGGGPCYIVSCGKYNTDNSVSETLMDEALKAVRKEDEPTLVLFTDAISLGLDKISAYYQLYKTALAQSSELMDRIAIIDLLIDPLKRGEELFSTLESGFRTEIGNTSLSYGAAYYPWLKTTLDYYIDESTILISAGAGFTLPSDTVLRKFPEEGSNEVSPGNSQLSLYHCQSSAYAMIKKEIDKFKIISPPGPAIAGIYAAVDSARGVWKAPANVSLNMVKEPMVKIDDEDQKDMNVTDSGKSVNAIRMFSGKGVMVWGARTLAGNDNEWRYVSVRRFYNMVEESVKKATEPFVFEPNDKNTWVRVKAMIENYLILKWREGALMGAKPEEAFFVKVGLGETMTALDILEGRMIVEIGMAVVRPAEFIILRFSHKMAVS
jgi:uncharacterized protein